MRSKEFEIVRDLIEGREPPQPEEVYQYRSTLTPAPFREIDGEVLARQYVAYRKFLETEAQARNGDGEAVLTGGGHAPKLRGERRPERTGQEDSSGWFSGLSRLWRR
jgi:hypothetical protein